MSSTTVCTVACRITFRYNFCQLWKALVTRDKKLGKVTTANLGVPKAYDGLSLILTFRLPDSEAPLGGKLTLEDRKKMIEKFKGEEKWTAADVNKFMENLPRDMLFVLRTLNIVRSLNKSLGGSSRERFDAMSESMLKGLALEGDINEMRDQSSAEKMRQALNTPVASELFRKRKSWIEAFVTFFKFLYLRINLRIINFAMAVNQLLSKRRKLVREASEELRARRDGTRPREMG